MSHRREPTAGLAFSFRLAPSNRKSHSNFKHVRCILGKPKNQENKFFGGSSRSIWPALALCKIVFVRKNLGSLSIRNIAWAENRLIMLRVGMGCFALDDARAKKGS